MSNIENFAKAAQKSGRPGEQNELLQHVKNERAKLEKMKKDSGIKKLAKFPEEGPSMAAALGRPDDLIDYVMTSQTMHGTLLGTGVSFAKDKSSVVPIGLKTDHPEAILAVAGRALDYLFLAACSAVKLVEPSGLSELTEIVEHARTTQPGMRGSRNVDTVRSYLQLAYQCEAITDHAGTFLTV